MRNKTIFIALVLGAVLTVASSLLVSIYQPLRITHQSPSKQALEFIDNTINDHEWFMGNPDVQHVTSEMGRMSSVVFGRIITDYYDSGGTRYYPTHEFGIVESGFPLGCFEGTIHRRNNEVEGLEWAVPIGDNMIAYLTVIPLKPRIIPFLVNSIAYGFVAFVTIVGIRRYKISNKSHHPTTTRRCVCDVFP